MTVQHPGTLIHLLKNRQNFLEEIHHNERLNSKIISLLLISFGGFFVYGGIIGASNAQMPLQIISSAIKLPALYLITLLICVPTLYRTHLGSILGVEYSKNAIFKQLD